MARKNKNTQPADNRKMLDFLALGNRQLLLEFKETPTRPSEKVWCKCILACAWRGCHDSGEFVKIEPELLEKDPFVKAHFEIYRKG